MILDSGFYLYSEVIEISGAGGVNTAALTVPVGELWEVKHLVGSHDDASARNCFWTFDDGVTTYQLAESLSIATNIRDQFYERIHLMGPLILRHGLVLSWVVSSIGGGQVATLRGLVYKLRGLPLEE
ncbi:unnamed protein product [marine sediment metagenome]|uniref:Uncharacterized protein n=1 Tax=marine sediment metagenome TaxID=412755 RepID=X1JMG1_9ZZZZ